MKTGKSPTASLMRVFAIALLVLAVGAVANSARAAGEPDLKITMTHTENFDIGSLGTYTIIVDNTEGAGDILGATETTVTITLPQGLTAEPANFFINGWTCSSVPVEDAPDTVTCTSSEDIYAPPNSPQVYSDLTFNVRVDKNEYDNGFPDSLTTTAHVSVPGEADTSDNDASDLTFIDKSDLDIIAVSFSPAQPEAGAPFEILVTVRNNGTAGSESVVPRSVFVDHHPFDLDPDGCATTLPHTPADYSDFERGELNDQIVEGSETQQPVSTLTHGPSPTFGYSLPAGTYQIYVMADATCINVESNENNNVYGPVTLTVIEATDPPPPPGECGHVFRDVGTAYWACSFIETLSRNGVTGGCRVDSTGKDYCPDDPVTRAQMAVFLERGIKGSTFAPPNIPATFLDTVGHWAMIWIEALKADGITGGCLAGYYCPDYPTTRAQMAVFLLKAKYGSTYAPPAVGGSTSFTDVPLDYWAAAWIKQLAAEGITGGCGAGVYCPENSVTRAQMAVFLVRTFGLK